MDLAPSRARAGLMSSVVKIVIMSLSNTFRQNYYLNQLGIADISV